jgi:hypothetical protein
MPELHEDGKDPAWVAIQLEPGKQKATRPRDQVDGRLLSIRGRRRSDCRCPGPPRRAPVNPVGRMSTKAPLICDNFSGVCGGVIHAAVSAPDLNAVNRKGHRLRAALCGSATLSYIGYTF